MESSNKYKEIDNITIHVIENNIVLTQDIIYDFLTTGNKSPIETLIIKQAQFIKQAYALGSSDDDIDNNYVCIST